MTICDGFLLNLEGAVKQNADNKENEIEDGFFKCYM